ncbi:MAG: FMN-binding protein [Ruminococcus sp.]|nr:FMN-binding protein [Ruminococcus sp.]
MLFLISLAAAVLTASLLDRPLKKHPAVFYLTAAVLTAVSVIVVQSGVDIPSRFLRAYVLGIFSRGALGAAFWAVVMWAGALPNGSAPIKKLMPVCGELSITAAILTLSHIIPYGMQYISGYIRGRTGSDFAVTSTVSIVMVLIMVPLTVMSFKAVRRKMNAKTWKKIQRFAYIFYALIYVHIMVLFVPKARSGREGYFLSVLVYSAVFVGYAVMRIRKYNLAKKKPDPKLIPNIVSLCVIALTIVAAASVSRSTKPEKTVSEPVENAAVFTCSPETTAATTASTVPQTDESETTAVTETTDTASDTVTDTCASSDESTAEVTAESATETTAAPSEATAEESNDEEPAPEQPESEVTYRYRNGEYEAEADGYTGKVHVKLTIENDVITSISAWADEDDTEYFGDAMNTVIPQIASGGSADGIDACSGATYSSKGIIEAARKALEQAVN